MITEVTEYIDNHEKWTQELKLLRSLLLALPVEETFKWKAPTYTYQGKNIIGIAAFKEYVGLWFHHGVYLKDEAGLLVNAQEGKTQALRQWRLAEIEPSLVPVIKSYLQEAVMNAEQGKFYKPKKKTAALSIPEELAVAMKADAALEQAFMSLTPGKQREFAQHISEAKREATRLNRLAKVLPLIKAGKGLYDKYKK